MLSSNQGFRRTLRCLPLAVCHTPNAEETMSFVGAAVWSNCLKILAVTLVNILKQAKIEIGHVCSINACNKPFKAVILWY